MDEQKLRDAIEHGKELVHRGQFTHEARNAVALLVGAAESLLAGVPCEVRMMCSGTAAHVNGDPFGLAARGGDAVDALIVRLPESA